MRRAIKDIVLPVAVAIVLAFVIQAAVAKPYEIPTASMEPTIQSDDRIIANRVIYRVRDIERGDIIVFDPPQSAIRSCPGDGSGDIPFVKRVIGLPGDKITVMNGMTFVNGEPYVVADSARPDYSIPASGPDSVPVVPEDSLFVLGDNRPDSCDSSRWDPDPFVPQDSVIGQAEMIYWPLNNIAFLD
jgi:signal peptidase I